MILFIYLSFCGLFQLLPWQHHPRSTWQWSRLWPGALCKLHFFPLGHPPGSTAKWHWWKKISFVIYLLKITLFFFFFRRQCSLLYLHLTVENNETLGDVEQQVVDGDHHIADCGLSIHFCSFQMHWKLLVELMAVWDQVVFAQPRKLEHVSVKSLEVLSAPCAADAADMVANWKGQIESRKVKTIINLLCFSLYL